MPGIKGVGGKTRMYSKKMTVKKGKKASKKKRPMKRSNVSY